jgi:iron complex outermembrane recepter protein
MPKTHPHPRKTLGQLTHNHGNPEAAFRLRATVLAASLALMHLTAAAQATAVEEKKEEKTPDAAAQPAAAVENKDDKQPKQLDRIVIIGSTSLRRTVRESSVAVTVADRDQIDKKAPRSTASALEMVPGIMVEDSGGEASNNFSVRGLPGGGQQFIQILEDGLPVFYTPALTDTILKQELSIDRLEAVRGGTSGILTVNGAGAMINFQTYKNTLEPEGAMRVTLSDYKTRRVDLRHGGSVGEGWFYGVGGFYRVSDSVRDTGFTADNGGIFRGLVGKKWSDGEFSVNLKLVDEHNTFLLPIPLQNLDNPKGIPGLNANYGTLLGRDNGTMTVRTSASTGATSQLNDAINDGIQTKATALGYSVEQSLAKEWRLKSKGRYTDFKNDFNSVFSFSNDGLVPALTRLNRNTNIPVAQQRADVNAMLARFASACGGTCTPALQQVSTGQLFATDAQLDAMNGNGLVAENVTARNKRYVKEFVNDAAVTWTTSNNSLTLGWLAFETHVNKDQNVGATSFLSDVKSNANRMDIVALNPDGQIVGYLTDKSVLQYNTWGEGVNNSKATSHSLYVNNEWKATENLRVDGGVRWERYSITARNGIGVSPTERRIPGAFLADGVTDVDNIIGNNNFGGAFSGQFNTTKANWTEPSWTIGSNYLINDNLAVYGRYSSSYNANGANPVTNINFAEVGARFRARGLSAMVTLFRTDYKNFRGFSRLIGNDTEATVASSDFLVNGIEFELDYKPIREFGITLGGVLQKHDLTITDVTGPSAALLRDELSSYSGNIPERTPKVNFTLTPTYYLPGGKGELSLSIQRIGKRYADLANSIALPAYTTLALSGRYELTSKISLHASIQNLTNEIGLTEGNPRGGTSAFQEATGSNYFFARPILGRNMQVSATFAF